MENWGTERTRSQSQEIGLGSPTPEAILKCYMPGPLAYRLETPSPPLASPRHGEACSLLHRANVSHFAFGCEWQTSAQISWTKNKMFDLRKQEVQMSGESHHWLIQQFNSNFWNRGVSSSLLAIRHPPGPACVLAECSLHPLPLPFPISSAASHGSCSDSFQMSAPLPSLLYAGGSPPCSRAALPLTVWACHRCQLSLSESKLHEGRNPMYFCSTLCL